MLAKVSVFSNDRTSYENVFGRDFLKPSKNSLIDVVIESIPHPFPLVSTDASCTFSSNLAWSFKNVGVILNSFATSPFLLPESTASTTFIFSSREKCQCSLFPLLAIPIEWGLGHNYQGCVRSSLWFVLPHVWKTEKTKWSAYQEPKIMNPPPQPPPKGWVQIFKNPIRKW